MESNGYHHYPELIKIADGTPDVIPAALGILTGSPPSPVTLALGSQK
jgi:hypothetical protein